MEDGLHSAVSAQGGEAEDKTPQLQNIKVFLAVAEAQSIARAAKALFKAPSAVSRAVVELEKSLGVPLFERGARGIILNEYGEIVQRRGERIEAEMAASAAELVKIKARTSSPSPSAVSHLLFNNRKLELLIHLNETRKISTAADRMGITQSGASMSLGRIEAALGGPLFHRGLQGIMPTEVAGRVAIRAKRVFAEIRHMLLDVTAVSGSFAGTVVIGALPLGRTHVFPMAIAEAISRYPKIQVTTVDSPFDQLVTGLRCGDIDVVAGVPRQETDLSGLIIEPLFSDRLIVVARKDHPLREKTRLSLSDVVDQRWILPWRASPSRKLFDAAFEAAGLSAPMANVESADLPVIRQLVGASDALAFASRRQMKYELDSGLLVELDIGLSGMDREVSLILREGALLSPVAQSLIDALKRQAHEIA